jgi:hypothetical protein
MPEAVTLEFLAARVAALTDDMQDMKLRMSALENRFTGLEARLRCGSAGLSAAST